MIDILLQQQAFSLEGKLMVLLFSCNDPLHYDRLQRVLKQAERRYWRRYRRAWPSGNETPDWFYRDAKSGY